MTSDEYRHLMQRLDGLQTLILAQQRWLLLELARLHADQAAWQICSEPVKKQERMIEIRFHRENVELERLEKSWSELLDLTRSVVWQLDREN